MLFIAFLFTLVLLVPFAASAADHDVEYYTQILTEHPWMVKEYTAFPHHDLNGDGVGNTNLLVEMDFETTDDHWVFIADGTFLVDQVKHIHDSSKNQIYVKGDWSFKDNGLVIEMIGREYDGVALTHVEELFIIELTNYSFEYFNPVQHAGVQDKIHIFMKLVPDTRKID